MNGSRIPGRARTLIFDATASVNSLVAACKETTPLLFWPIPDSFVAKPGETNETFAPPRASVEVALSENLDASLSRMFDPSQPPAITSVNLLKSEKRLKKLASEPEIG